MRLAQALLCDAANVRSGLMFMIGGGISILFREDFPAPMAVSAAFVGVAEEGDFNRPLPMAARVHRRDADPPQLVTELRGETTDTPGQHAGLPSYAPSAYPLNDVGLPDIGSYDVEIEVDGTVLATIPFAVQPASDRPIG